MEKKKEKEIINIKIHIFTSFAPLPCVFCYYLPKGSITYKNKYK